MTYYTASQFKELWYMTFKDMKGGDWRISIESPTYTGDNPIQLTPAANPFEWMGSGDEDQTKCILGSTGTMRIMVTNESDIANLRPTELNNRRVTAKRNNVILWQGFLKQEEYSQDWVAAPYELELPIRSALDLANDMPLKPYVDMPSVTKVHELIDEVIAQLGIDVTAWRTNYGETDWSVYTCHKEHYYTFDVRDFSSKTISKVLESVFYPYGHIREYGSLWFMSLDVKDFSDQYSHTVGASTGLTTTNTTLRHLGMSALEIAGTENTVSRVEAPSKVTFKHEYEGDSHILKFDNDCIKPEWTPGYMEKIEDTEGDYYYFKVNRNILVYETLFSLTNISGSKGVCRYGRIIKGEIEDNGKQYRRAKFTTTAPLSVYLFNDRSITDDSQAAKGVLHIVRHGFCGSAGNALMFSTKAFNVKGKEDDNPEYARMAIRVKQNGSTLWLHYTNYANYTFSSEENWYQLDQTDEDQIFEGQSGNERIIALNNLPDGEYEILYTLSKDHKDTGCYLLPEVYYRNISYFSDSQLGNAIVFDIDNTKTITGNGGGDSVDIEFKSLNGINHLKGDGICYSAPYRLFCEETTYIDINPRTKMELEEVRMSNVTMLVTEPMFITKGSEYYIPVATGMNARNCTTQLRLVSTNI